MNNVEKAQKEVKLFEFGVREGRKQIQDELIKLLGLWDKFQPLEEND